MAKGKFKSPKGTRDLYPDDLLRQRYITEAWRRVSLRHGFDEIAGPTFEHLDLYTVKSGEGIVSELFSFRREGGDDDYALRPEFTPTLARLYAAKAASLPSPTKWFTAGPYFRAERPQRGRLREFLQWNCDVIGGADDSGLQADQDVATVLLDLVRSIGCSTADFQLKLNDRRVIARLAQKGKIPPEQFQTFLFVLDQKDKHPEEWVAEQFMSASISEEEGMRAFNFYKTVQADWKAGGATFELSDDEKRDNVRLGTALSKSGWSGWFDYDPMIARGLAYYTGTVFELIADGERAVAGGGRYDKLMKMFGTKEDVPAVGFGMGDVVLSLLLEDKNLMPEGAELREALSQPGASLRPEVFVLADEDQSEHVEPLLATLRRGIESPEHDPGRPWSGDRYDIRPMHARRSYRAKRKKQMQDASAQFAQFAVTVNEPDKVELRDMDNPGDDLTPNLIDAFPKEVRSSYADFSVDPESPVYVGSAIASLLGGR